MSRLVRVLFAAAAIALVAGCAGTNFKRPDPGLLVIGKSTASDVQAAMGSPSRTGEALRNGERVKTWTYAYASAAGEPAYPGVTPARAVSFVMYKDVLVGHEFISSFKADTTDFDESRMSGITKGKTSRAEVVALLGKPNGEAIYPAIKQRDQKAIVYSYTQAKGTVFNMKFHVKKLVVSFTPDDVVSDVDYVSSGER